MPVNAAVLRMLWDCVVRDERDSCGWTMDDYCDECTCGYDNFMAAIAAAPLTDGSET
jgi:hypothetical protein